MPSIISVYNNKGGVGKTTISWNLSDSLARLGHKVLLIDFDPQCNLSIAILGEDEFKNTLPNQNKPYGTTIRSYLQNFLQGIGDAELFFHHGAHTHKNVDLVAGDFWLNIYSESLSVGSDLLTGTGIAKYSVINDIVVVAKDKYGKDYDFVIVDIPPSFGALVRVALYSSDYFVIPCTSDTFSSYCVGLIGEMLPKFVEDWKSGYERFKASNRNITRYEDLGEPKFAGWIFNGFDMRGGSVVRADKIHKLNLSKAIKEDLIDPGKVGVADNLTGDFMIGDIEDMNVLIQNSIWLQVPVSQLSNVQPLRTLRDRGSWSQNQLIQITTLETKFKELAENIVSICG